MSLRTVLIGNGRIGWNLENDALRYHPCTHGGSLKHFTENHPDYVELVGVCDLEKDHMNELENWWGETIPNQSTDAGNLIDETLPDLVIIASSLDSHYDIAHHAILTGVKGILLEKPVTENHRSTLTLHHLSREKRIPVWINFERQYHPAYRHIKTIIENGELGPVRGVRGRVLTGSGFDANSEAGPLLNDAVHWIDLLIWMLGSPLTVSGKVKRDTRNRNVFEESVIAIFEYDSFSAILESDGKRKYFEFLMEIDFEDGRIQCGNEGHFIYRSTRSNKYVKFRDLNPVNHDFPKGNPWIIMYTDIINELNNPSGKDVSSRDNFDGAVEGMKWIQQLLD